MGKTYDFTKFKGAMDATWEVTYRALGLAGGKGTLVVTGSTEAEARANAERSIKLLHVEDPKIVSIKPEE